METKTLLERITKKLWLFRYYILALAFILSVIYLVQVIVLLQFFWRFIAGLILWMLNGGNFAKSFGVVFN